MSKNETPKNSLNLFLYIKFKESYINRSLVFLLLFYQKQKKLNRLSKNNSIVIHNLFDMRKENI